MKISSCGGVIAAASEKSAFPLHRIGGTTAVQRIVMNYQQAGVFPIVVISGAEEAEVRYRLSSSGVVFLRPEVLHPEVLHPQVPGPEAAGPLELFDSVKTGLAFLQDICGKVVFTPVNAPMFSPATLRLLMRSEGQLVSPSHRGRSGHPLVVASGAIPDILAYRGANGLRGALETMRGRRAWVEVDDAGILYSVRDGDIPAEALARHSEALLHLAAELHLRRDRSIFDARTKLLLLLIMKNYSVRAACGQMALSYSKAWEMLNTLEDSLTVKLVTRRHGGARGGKTALTGQGLLFLQEYQRIEEEAVRFTQKQFDSLKSLLLP